MKTLLTMLICGWIMWTTHPLKGLEKFDWESQGFTYATSVHGYKIDHWAMYPNYHSRIVKITQGDKICYIPQNRIIEIFPEGEKK